MGIEIRLEDIEKEMGEVRNEAKYREYINEVHNELEKLNNKSLSEKIKDYFVYSFYDVCDAFKSFDWKKAYKNIF